MIAHVGIPLTVYTDGMRTFQHRLAIVFVSQEVGCAAVCNSVFGQKQTVSFCSLKNSHFAHPPTTLYLVRMF